jgi:hypothetical protein
MKTTVDLQLWGLSAKDMAMLQVILEKMSTYNLRHSNTISDYGVANCGEEEYSSAFKAACDTVYGPEHKEEK